LIKNNQYWMLKQERYDHILATLASEKKVTAATLSRDLRLSEATVRRDLTDLDRLGKLRKVHGGAVPVTASPFSFQQRQEMQSEAKHAIAQKVLPLLAEARTVILDAGTTNLTLVKCLPADTAVTCITNSPTIAQHLATYQQVEVLLTGGTYVARDEALLGPWATQTLKNVYADVCVLGVCSIHAQHGLTTDDLAQATVKQTMMQQARRTIALADREKIDRIEAYRIGEVDQLATIVTDLPPDDERWRIYRGRDVEIF
jgi:DeoR/GlpR family transcriptional regulator of sugar metabolism